MGPLNRLRNKVQSYNSRNFKIICNMFKKVNKKRNYGFLNKITGLKGRFQSFIKVITGDLSNENFNKDIYLIETMQQFLKHSKIYKELHLKFVLDVLVLKAIFEVIF